MSLDRTHEAAQQAHEADEVRDGERRGPRSLCAVLGGRDPDLL